MNIGSQYYHVFNGKAICTFHSYYVPNGKVQMYYSHNTFCNKHVYYVSNGKVQMYYPIKNIIVLIFCYKHDYYVPNGKCIIVTDI